MLASYTTTGQTPLSERAEMQVLKVFDMGKENTDNSLNGETEYPPKEKEKNHGKSNNRKSSSSKRKSSN